MAVEDGAVLGRLLGLFDKNHCSKSSLPSLMQLYQDVRKDRAQTAVKTANGNRFLYHMRDGPEQEKRDRILSNHDWWDESLSCPYVFADISHLHELYGFDTLKSADHAFEKSVFQRSA